MDTRTKKLFTLLVLAFLAVPGTAEAQDPPEVGSATALGLGSMTEARLSEAALWNPALAGIFDGPMSSWSILGLDLEPGDIDTNIGLYSHIPELRSFIFFPVDEELKELATEISSDGDMSGSRRIEGKVQWVGIHSRDLLISATSQAYGWVTIPERVAGIIRGEESARFDPVTEEEIGVLTREPTEYSIISTLAIAKGMDAGDLPLLGRTWLGASVKGAMVHDRVYGRFLYEDATVLIPEDTLGFGPTGVEAEPGELGAVYDELALPGARIYSTDIGIVFHPRPYLLASVSANNIFQKVYLGDRSIEWRRLAFAGQDTLGANYGFSGAQNLTQEIIASLREQGSDIPILADHAAATTHLSPRLRMGLSLDTEMGRFVGGYAIPLAETDGMFHRSQDKFTLAYVDPNSRWKPRASYSVREDGSIAISLGALHGFCTDRWGLSAGYVRVPRAPDSFTLGVSWGRGEAPCGRYR